MPSPSFDDPRHVAPGAASGKAPAQADSPIPLYHQIYVTLRNRILSGELSEGMVLPGEKDLAQAFGVSRITAKRALNELASSGYVVRERGRGTRVTGVHPRPSEPTRVDGWLENISLMGEATDAKVLEFGYLPAGTAIAEALDIEEGDQVQRVVRVRSLDGESLSYLTTYVPGDIGADFDAGDLERHSLLQLLERAGIQVASARQSVSAALADPIVAGALGIEAGAPLLEVIRTVFDRNDRPVEFIHVLYRPDRYRFEMDLTRRDDGVKALWASEGHHA